MDLATIIGLVGGTVLVLMAIFMGGGIGMFIDIPSILIVLGGTIAVTFIRFSMKDVFNSVAVAMKAFIFKIDPPDEVVARMVQYAQIAKKEGLISLENETPPDEFSAKALRYLADGYDEGLIEDMLDKDIRLTIGRHSVGQSVFKSMGGAAPAFGMIGTLIGLVQMLGNMSDPSSIGPAMAVALLTTLYGALVANLVCLPIVDKLYMRSTQEQTNRKIVREAAVYMCQGIAPAVLSESLKIYLSPKDRKKTEEKKPA
jgi:chemotaxis protein MotA